jgi:hypothetical protein
MRKKDMPSCSYQVDERKAKREYLSRRINEFLERAVTAGVLEYR